MIETIAIVVLSLVALIAAIYAVRCKKAITAVLASGVISLMASIVFLFVAAPDVAMTEAAIGSGLTTVVFLYALKHVKTGKEPEDD